jgi:MFS family permease
VAAPEPALAPSPPDTADDLPCSHPPDSPGGRIVFRLAAALTYRDFRLLWLGALTSSIGTWMQRVAQAWLIVTLAGTASAFFLGLDSFLGELPILLFTLIGGVVADRQDRRQLLLMSQAVQMLAAFALAALVYTGAVHIALILLLSFATGMAQAFGGPAYQSLIPSLIHKEHLPNAVALNSIQFNLARVIGPLAAGAALAAFGMVACFGLNGLSFLFVIGAILALRVKHVPPATRQRMVDEMKGGLRYVRDEPMLVTVTTIGFIAAFLGLPLLTFLPIVVRDVFQEDVGRYTVMMTYSGLGAVAGALAVAWLGRSRHMGRVLLAVLFAFGLTLIAFSMTRTLWMSELLLFLAGALLVTSFSLTTSLVQLIAPNELRGRVMSIYMVAFRGAAPLGNFISGNLITIASAPLVIGMNGVLLVIAAVYFRVRGHGIREF